ncbi:hypothetical protein HanIR_Chr02g0051541 [Helianthus annuus]|nr:hypothetical protein HanIR_Chr02g0051541 [Helianthus annuus]
MSSSTDGWKSSSSLISISGSLAVSNVNISGAGAISLSVEVAVGSSISDNSLSKEGQFIVITYYIAYTCVPAHNNHSIYIHSNHLLYCKQGQFIM